MRNIGRQGAGRVGVLLTCAFLVSAAGHAVSLTPPVKIVRFDYQGNNYTLVVHPAKTNPPALYRGICERFEVRGSYGSLRGSSRDQEPGLSKSAHREAIQFLHDAFVAGQIIDLGWVGTGFVPVEAGEPCVVKSRALQLVKDELGTHVLSYHDATPLLSK